MTGHFYASRSKLTELALDCNLASWPYGASGLRVGVDGAPLKLLTHITLIWQPSLRPWACIFRLSRPCVSFPTILCQASPNAPLQQHHGCSDCSRFLLMKSN